MFLDTSVHPSFDEHGGQIGGARSDLGAFSTSLVGSYPTSVTCKLLIPFSNCASNLVADSLVFPYFCVHPHTKQEAEASNTYNSKSHLDLGTQYPSLGL